MLYLTSDARTYVARFAEDGLCPSDSRVLDIINQATRRLLERTDAAAYTTKRARFCMSNSNTLTLPREFAGIVSNPVIDCVPRRVFGFHYETLENSVGDLGVCGGYGPDLLDLGPGYPTFFDIPSDAPRYLTAFSTEASDTDKTIYLRGKDVGWAEIYTEGSLGESLPINKWTHGTEGLINVSLNPVVTSVNKFNEITSLQKPVTDGFISLFTYEPDTHQLYFLCKYHPHETVPGYRRYRLSCPNFTSGNNVLVNVRLAYVPAVLDTDPLLIQNLDALKLMAQSIRAENATDINGSIALEAKAVMILTNQVGQKQVTGDNVFQVSDPWGCGSRANII